MIGLSCGEETITTCYSGAQSPPMALSKKNNRNGTTDTSVFRAT